MSDFNETLTAEKLTRLENRVFCLESLATMPRSQKDKRDITRDYLEDLIKRKKNIIKESHPEMNGLPLREEIKFLEAALSLIRLNDD